MPDLQAASESAVPLLPSGLDQFDKLLDQFDVALQQVLDLSGVKYDDINARSEVLFIGWNVQQWLPLPDEAAPKVGAARDALRKLREFASRASRNAPDRGKELRKIETSFNRLVEQPNGSLPRGAPKGTIDGIRDHAAEKIDEYRQVVRRLPSAHGDGEQLLVADTSALLDRPDLQNWHLDVGRWTLILLPQVLSELDERKRDDRTRDAAQKVINQIEDFDRRGDTFAGVPLAGDATVREVPTSPDMNETLPWLRSDVPDDAIIAGALELIWQDLTSCVAVTASDRNVRNKARLAGLGTIRPADL
jgi:hypothetical protein